MSTRYILSTALFATALLCVGQSGTIDLSFDPGTGPNDEVKAVKLQPDGKILIAGNFSSYNGTPVSYVARLNSDGSLDPSFNVGTGPNYPAGNVYVFALQPDGKILVGGDFSSFNGQVRSCIARLEADGSVDPSFDPGYGATGTSFTQPIVQTIALQANGKILLGGWFMQFNRLLNENLIRLEPNGTLDLTFNPVPNDLVAKVVVQPDMRILVAGSFTTCSGVARNRIARLNSNGTIDASFNPGTGATHAIASMDLNTDGTILISGTFIGYDTVTSAAFRLAKVNSNGSFHAPFASRLVGTQHTIAPLYLPDGRLILGGTLIGYDGVPVIQLAYANADGSVNTSFDIGAGFVSTGTPVASMERQPDGAIIMAGSFSSFHGVARNNIVRLIGPELATAITETAPRARSPRIWPNPTSDGRFWIEAGFANVTYEVFGLLGNRIQPATAPQPAVNGGIIDLGQDLANGPYIIRLTHDGGTSTMRVLIQH